MKDLCQITQQNASFKIHQVLNIEFYYVWIHDEGDDGGRQEESDPPPAAAGITKVVSYLTWVLETQTRVL